MAQYPIRTALVDATGKNGDPRFASMPALALLSNAINNAIVMLVPMAVIDPRGAADRKTRCNRTRNYRTNFRLG